jgi:transcriptional regulator with GAF, ATPase, and Fis domain
MLAALPSETVAMAVLILLRGEEPVVRFALGETATIGRSSDCEVQLADTELSRKHACLRKRDTAHWELEDLGSRNGTRVDGAVIRGGIASLREGALIELGAARLLFDPPLDVIGDREGDARLLLVRDEAAARGARRLAAAHAIAPELARGIALIDAADRSGLGALLAMLCTELGAERACLVTNRDGMLRPLCVYGGKAVTASTTLIQRAITEGIPLAVDDAQGDVSFAVAKSILAHDLRSVIVAPLVHDGAQVGVLQIDHSQRARFDDNVLARVAALAPAVALAVARTRPKASMQVAQPAIVGEDKRLHAALDDATRAGAAGTQLLVLGESGTGKELVARAYHAAGRVNGPWVAVNCAA